MASVNHVDQPVCCLRLLWTSELYSAIIRGQWVRIKLIK